MFHEFKQYKVDKLKALGKLPKFLKTTIFRFGKPAKSPMRSLTKKVIESEKPIIKIEQTKRRKGLRKALSST